MKKVNFNIQVRGLKLPDYVSQTGILGFCDDQYNTCNGVKTIDQLNPDQLNAIKIFFKSLNHTDAEPFRKSGKVLDESIFDEIAQASPEAVETAIVALRKANMVKTAELIEATEDET